MKNFLKNGLSSIIEMGLNAIISFGLSVFISKYYGIEKLGIYSFVASFAAIAVSITNFGITPYYIRKIAQTKFNINIINHLVNIRLYISVLFYLVISVFIVWLANKGTYFYEYIALIFLFCAINFNMLLSSILNSQERNSDIFKYNLIYKVGLLLIILYIGQIDRIKFEYFIASLFVVALFQVLIIIKYKINNINLKIKYRAFKFRVIAIKKTISIGVPGVFEVIINRIDVLIIGLYLNEFSMGLYSAAYSYFMMYTLFSLAVTKVFFARFAYYFKINKDQAYKFLKQYAFITLTYSTIGAFMLYVSAEKFVYIFYGETFDKATDLVKGLSFCLIPLTLNRLFGHVMNAVGKFNFYFYCTGIGVVISILINLILINKTFLYAPIYATFFAESITLILMIYIIYKKNIFE